MAVYAATASARLHNLGVRAPGATIALADPTWSLKPQPVFQTNAARVVVVALHLGDEFEEIADAALG